MGLEVANITARLGAHFDDSPFNRFDKRVDKARSEASRPITAHAAVKADTSGVDRYEKRVNDVSVAHDNLAAGGRKTDSVLKTLGKTAAYTAGPAAFGAMVFAGKKAFDAYKESERVGRQTNAVLLSTGGAAGLSAKQINDLANSISRKTGIDDEAIQSGENLLLTFTNIKNEAGKGNDIFTQTTSIMTDMSAALGQDTKSSAIQLGKALNDPIKGVTALQRVGVSFTKSQKDQIKTLVGSGKTLDAQKLILKELTKEFGGSAAATATSSKRLGVTMGNLSESIGKALSPAFEKIAKGLDKFISGALDGTGAGGKFAAIIKQVAHAIGTVLSAAITVGKKAFDFIKQAINDNRSSLERIGRAVSSLASTIFGAFKSIVRSFKDTFGQGSGSGDAIKNIIKVFLTLESAVMSVYSSIAKRVLPGIVTAFRGFFQVIRGIIRIISGVLTGDFGKAWDGVKDIFSGALKAIFGVLRAATAPFRAAIAFVGKGIGSAFSAVWSGVVSVATGFINKIIDVINIIPGVNIHHVGGGGGGKANAGSGSSTQRGVPYAPGNVTSPFNSGPTAFAQGGKVMAPVAIMGEEAPEHPEWVIPTNPAYRKRAVGLWMATARDLGIPGFLDGGKLLKGAGNIIKKAPGAVLDQAINVIPGVGAVRSATGLAEKLIGKLPGNPGGILKGTWDYSLGKAKSFIKDKASSAFDKAKSALASVFTGGGGGTGGLVPQVLNALAWAKAHGWGGSVISGYRSPASQIIAGTLFAQRLGKPVSAVYPNGLLASSHVTGQAVDVTDPGGFARALRGAPPGSFIHNAIPWDPAHFSVSGNRMGGILGMIGGKWGGELLATGTMAFKKGGLKAARKAVKAARTTYQRHEGGIANYEDWLSGKEDDYSRRSRRFDLTDEVLLIENEDGSTSVDTAAQNARIAELSGDKGLRPLRVEIRDKVIKYRERVATLIGDYTKAISRLNAAIKAASGKKRAKERKGYKNEAANYKSRIKELKRLKDRTLKGELDDQNIDLGELDNEIAAVGGTAGKAADPVKPEPPAAPDLSLGAAFTGSEATTASGISKDQALAELTPSTADDEAVRGRGEAFYRGVLDRLQAAGAPDDTIIAAANALKGFLPADKGSDPTTPPATADDIATAIATALSQFNSGRADLFGQFGSNFLANGQRLSNADMAAGARFFGGGSSGSDGPGTLGAGGVTQYISFTAPTPPDPHTFSAAVLHETAAIV